jgi:hypothetical protein
MIVALLDGKKKTSGEIPHDALRTACGGYQKVSA